MSTNNPMEILVHLTANEESSQTTLNAQIDELSKKLKDLELNINIDERSAKALEDLSKIDFSSMQKTMQGAEDAVKRFGNEADNTKKTLSGIGDEAKGVFSGIGREADGAGDQIAGTFNDAQKRIQKSFSHLGDDFQRVMGRGVSEVDELKKAFHGMDASFSSVEEILSEDLVTGETRKIKSIEASYKNLQGQIEQVKFVAKDFIAGEGDTLIPLWVPDSEVKVLDATMKNMEQATKKANDQLHRLSSTGKITSDQFKELSADVNKFSSAGDVDKFNRRLFDAQQNTKKLNEEAKEQVKIQEQIRKLENDIVRVQQKDPRGFGKDPASNEMLNTLKSIDPAAKGASNAVKGVSDNFDRMKAEATAAGRESMTVMDSFKVAMEKFPVWMAASTAFYGTVRSIRDAISQIIDMDSQMTVLRRVAGDGVDVNRVLSESVQLAGKLGNEIADINEGFIAFARQGFRDEELTKMAEYATLLGNISELDVENAASVLTAGLKGFGIEAENAIRIVDSLNEVDINLSLMLVMA